ncbi:hypothetical protein KSS87_005120 [Heliosperma pusillum]|nr:hypothetical protein KSS87_005120 [Heliosperma pusillum]
MDSSSNSTKPMAELVSSNTSTSLSISISNSNNNNMNIISGSNANSRVRSKEMENLSFEISKYPRDLLQRFLGGVGNTNQSSSSSSSSRKIISLDDSIIIGNDEDDVGDDGDDEGGLNLGLGLSLGGKFGVDKSNKGLIRSSSIASTMPLFRDDDDVIGGGIIPPIVAKTSIATTRGVSSLVRTSSLPVETEEEWRKRKEIQTLRRMEAKRRRSEKQRALKDIGGSGGGGSGGGGGEERNVESLKFRGRLEREQQSLGITSKFIGSSMGNLFGSATPPPPPPSNVEVKGRRTTFGSLQGFLIAQGQGQGQQGSSQGSGESQGGGASSGTSELESKTHQASSSCGEARSPASIQSLQDRPSQEVLGSPLTNKGDISQRGRTGPEAESSSKQPMMVSENKKQEAGSSSGIEDMPCVFTIGDGPNGRKVEGILYRYGKGEHVRIMCVCHGTFLSPKDFVKHAGGRDVEHPLRHIVVSPSSSVFQ